MHFNVLPIGFRRIIIVLMVVVFFIGLTYSGHGNLIDPILEGLSAVFIYWLLVLAICWIYAGFKNDPINKK